MSQLKTTEFKCKYHQISEFLQPPEHINQNQQCVTCEHNYRQLTNNTTTDKTQINVGTYKDDWLETSQQTNSSTRQDTSLTSTMKSSTNQTTIGTNSSSKITAQNEREHSLDECYDIVLKDVYNSTNQQEALDKVIAITKAKLDKYNRENCKLRANLTQI